MQLLIFALLALAASADNYGGYYNPYSYGHGYGYPSYYGGLGYSSLYGHNYGIGAGKLSYALGGHGHYAYAPAKPGTVQVLYDSHPFLSRFESAAGPGRISFTLGASGTSGQSGSPGTHPRVSSFGKFTVANVQSTIAGAFEGRQSGSSAKRPGGHLSFVLGSPAAPGHAGIRSQENKPVVSNSGKWPSSAQSKITSGAGLLTGGGGRDASRAGSPGRITFTRDFSRLSGHSEDRFVAPPFPRDTSNFFVPKPGNILTSQRNLDSHSFERSPPQISREGGPPDFNSAAKLGQAFSVESRFAPFSSAGGSAAASGPSEDGAGGQDSKVFSGKPIADDKNSGLSHSSFDSDDKLPVFVAIPADDEDEGSDVASSSDGEGASIQTPPFLPSAEDKSSGEHSSHEHRADGGPWLDKHSSFSAAAGNAGHKVTTRKHSSKVHNPGYKSPVFVAVPESSTEDRSFQLGGSRAAERASVFEFSSAGLSRGTSSGVKSNNRGSVSSPTVKSFSGKAYEEFAYIPEMSPITAFLEDVHPAPGSSVAVVGPFSPLHDYEVFDIEKK